jgi:SpoVK/Ycf46/Vps4 family AAA+-type ATPase
VARACDGFTGSEIAAIVPDAMFAAFADGARPITTEDLVTAAATVAPLSKTAEEKITALRKWAATKARPATKPSDNVKLAASQGRALDL